MKKTQLTTEQRYHIYQLNKQGYPQVFIAKLLTPIKYQVKALTFDNGRAFSWHEKLAEKLESSTDFAKPYHNSGSVV